ncbi:Methyltransferase Ppm1/Ppm2/Tcmp [Acididesulfobacillus acetoxydans]|uniref:S-adenosyl-L-methionine-dependent methyltransferase n=1 Tax=Acididesulfobacillus acetoxydans TaxID=1561005 RepID=A0A8S0XZ05_9FIRM|nr:SAM-dependent methyltransferase [Acididesulfobacillus acetoxydans]CAA7602327.1 Methyltransferase Ppm1/Ppm2/Tcmp [Acididesulfobacillus acetoxydans]CEJ08438.1 Methyltransferase [Acididesulfobacillus acetoxydans]
MTKDDVGISDPAGEGPNIKNVSETALWVAYYRAVETRRRDALFHDPYAGVLAGERGEEIARTIPYGKNSAWSMTVRTCLLDEMILQLIGEEKVDAVLNLGAGLDTRPYRLPLPASFNWIEVDLPGILAYKEEKLAGVKPVCKLQSVSLNLADAVGAQTLFAEVNARNAGVLVLSEGLLAWLSREDVEALAKSLHEQANFTWWLMDLMTAALSRWLAQAGWSKATEAGDAKMQFAPEEGPDFFAPYGWKVAETRSMGLEARRLHREMPLAWLWRLLMPLASREKREMYRQLDSDVVLLTHS